MTKAKYNLAMKKSIFFIFLILCLSKLSAVETPIVQEINTILQNDDEIKITWILPTNTESINYFLLYKDFKPITSFKQIQEIDESLQLSKTTTSFIDKPNTYEPLYYAIIAVTDKMYPLIIPSYNSTIKAIKLKKSETKIPTEAIKNAPSTYPQGKSREAPLPAIAYNDKQNVSSLSTEAQSSISKLNINSTLTIKKTLMPYIFDDETIVPDGGDNLLLFDIIKNTFETQKYEECTQSLLQLLSTNISKDVQNRAYFYLGQTYYFTANYKTAISYFVKTESIFPSLSQKWTNSSLDFIN